MKPNPRAPIIRYGWKDALEVLLQKGGMLVRRQRGHAEVIDATGCCIGFLTKDTLALLDSMIEKTQNCEVPRLIVKRGVLQSAK